MDSPLYNTVILVRLRVEDIDSESMVIHIRKGKGGKDLAARV
jgi:hypothetical protein